MYYNLCHQHYILKEDEAPFHALNPSDVWIENPIVYLCIIRTLREVEIKGFKGTQNEFYLLAYLVIHGRVMQKLTVVTSREISNHGNPAVYRSVAEKLYALRRASQHLQITIL